MHVVVEIVNVSTKKTHDVGFPDTHRIVSGLPAPITKI